MGSVGFEGSSEQRVSEEANIRDQRDGLDDEEANNVTAWHLAFQQTNDLTASSESFTVSPPPTDINNGDDGIGSESEVVQRLHAQLQHNSRMMQEEEKLKQINPQSTTSPGSSTLDNNAQSVPDPMNSSVRSKSSGSSIKTPLPPELQRNNYGPTQPGAIAVGRQTQSTNDGSGAGSPEAPLAEENPKEEQTEQSPSSSLINAELVTEDANLHHVAATSAVPMGEEDLPLSQRGFRSILKDRRISCLVCTFILVIAGLATGLRFLFLQEKELPTAPPTASPTSRLPLLQSILEPYVDVTQWEMPNTTQYQAIQWLANEDTWRPTDSNSVEREILERYVMMVLYFSLDGPNWGGTTQFLDLSWHICEWNAQFSFGSYGVLCDGKKVTGFKVDDINAVGTIPTEVGLFSSLRTFDISYNRGITGTIPKEALRISTLEEIILPFLSLTGTLPSELLRLPRLSYFDVHNSNMHGPIDNVMNPALETLSISENQFTGTIPQAIGDLRFATYIEIGGNLLTGTLPRSLGNLGDRLKYLSVYNNVNLTGTVPDTYYDLSQVQTLYLEGTNLTEIEGPFCGTYPLLEGYDNFTADCGGPNPKVSCWCCTECCDDGLCPSSYT